MIESLKEFINSNESWRYMPSSALKNFIESDSKGLPIDIQHTKTPAILNSNNGNINALFNALEKFSNN